MGDSFVHASAFMDELDAAAGGIFSGGFVKAEQDNFQVGEGLLQQLAGFGEVETG